MPSLFPIKLTLLALLVLACAGCAALTGQPFSSYTLYPDLVFAERPDQTLHADVYVPRGTGPFPAVLVIHGGSWIGGKKAEMDRYARRLAKAGFVAVNIDYRLAPGHAHPAQIEDCRAALHWLRAQAVRFAIDPERVGVMGYSAGAHLALLLGLGDSERPADRIKAIVAGSAPTDLRVYPKSPYVNSLLGGPPEGREQAYADASPVTHVSPDDPPVFIYHGRRDSLVEIGQAELLVSALQKAGVEVEFQVEPFGHALTYVLDRGAFSKAMDFLARKFNLP